jgi:type VI secretion system protein ImpG
MDDRLLDYYASELRHLREMTGDFARTNPKIAGRLRLDPYGKDICPDPHVERLLQGFAWLAARVRMQMDAEFPRFTQSLLEIIFPQYLAPVPSMAIVQFEPDATQQTIASGMVMPRGTVLQSFMGKEDHVPCTFRTAHPVKLLPIKLTEASYYTRDLSRLDLPSDVRAKAALKLRLESTASLPFSQINLNPLALFLSGADNIPHLHYEQLVAHATGILIQTQEAGKRPVTRGCFSPKGIRKLGFNDEESLLPCTARGMEGYRLLREYFAFAQRFLFVEIGGFAEALAGMQEQQIDIVILFDTVERQLEARDDVSAFKLFCTPVINLFPKQTDRIVMEDRFSELHVAPDHNRPLDYEIFDIERVYGYDKDSVNVADYRPFFYARDRDLRHTAYYTTRRAPRTLTLAEEQIYRQYKRRPPNAGTDIYISIVDASGTTVRPGVRQLGARALCTNRNLPMSMAVGAAHTDFTLDENLPIRSVRCLVRPTDPIPSPAEGRFTWKLISHLSLNYLSLLDAPSSDAAAAFRELLKLYCGEGDRQEVARRQVEGLRDLKNKPVMRRINIAGPVTFARGLEMNLCFDETFFDGASTFLMGAVLEEFLARYVSLNSFTETVISTQQRGEIMRWPARSGRRQII